VLLHQKSGVRITVVQMPAVNTPQFSWVRSKLPRHPQPVPPIYQPEVAARGIVFAASHPRRRQYYVGAATTATILANRVVPGLLDRYLARTGYSSQQTGDREGSGRPGNLWAPADQARATTTVPTVSSTTSRIRAVRSWSCRTTGWPPPRRGWPPPRPA
jgi:hypothetical protein